MPAIFFIGIVIFLCAVNFKKSDTTSVYDRNNGLSQRERTERSIESRNRMMVEMIGKTKAEKRKIMKKHRINR